MEGSENSGRDAYDSEARGTFVPQFLGADWLFERALIGKPRRVLTNRRTVGVTVRYPQSSLEAARVVNFCPTTFDQFPNDQ